jgi:hypothetical protein
MKSALTVWILLAVPSAAWAGHVESSILREGTPGTYWRKHKDRILAQLNKTSNVAIADAVHQCSNRTQYAYAIVGALAHATADQKKACFGAHWSADYEAIYRRVQALPQSKLWNSDLKTPEWIEKVHEWLADDAARLKRLEKFLAEASVREAIVTRLRNSEGPNAEKVITDLVLILEFLQPENKGFFLNGYSHDELGKTGSYAALYPKLKWDSKTIAQIRQEAFDVLAEMGPAAIPIMERALKEVREHAKGEGHVKLPEGSLAVQTGWSTKAIRFGVPVHTGFKKDMVKLIKLAGGRAPETDETATADEAAAVFRKHQESIRKISGVRDLYIDQDDQTSFIVVVVATEKLRETLLDRFGAELEGVPIRIIRE